jgi:hypothetical protein
VQRKTQRLTTKWRRKHFRRLYRSTKTFSAHTQFLLNSPLPSTFTANDFWDVLGFSVGSTGPTIMFSAQFFFL